MSAQKVNAFKNMKTTILMVAVAILVLSPIMQLVMQGSAGASLSPPSGGSLSPPSGGSLGGSTGGGSTGSGGGSGSTGSTGSSGSTGGSTGTTTAPSTGSSGSTGVAYVAPAPPPDNGKIGVSTRIIGLKKSNKIDCTKKKNKKQCQVPSKRDAGKDWFKIQFTVTNQGNTTLNNVKLSWKPSVLVFKQKGKKNKALYVTPKSVTINQKSLKKGASVKYVAVAQFKKGVKPGTAIESKPSITADSRTKKVKDSAEFGKNVKVTGKDAGKQDNKKNEGLGITARVFNSEFNQNGKIQAPATAHYNYENDKNKPVAQKVFPYNSAAKRQVQPGEWFAIQLRVANKTGKKLNDAKVSWKPAKSNIQLPSNGNGNRNTKTEKITVTKESYQLDLKNFNSVDKKKKTGVRTYVVYAQFNEKAKPGETVTVMPSVTAKGQKGDKVDSINAVVKGGQAPAPTQNPLVVTKEVDTPNPILYAPFNYSIKVTNNSDKAQKVNISDLNTNPEAQNFESFTIEGATNSTLDILNGDKAEDVAEEDLVPPSDEEIVSDGTIASLQGAVAKAQQKFNAANKVFTNAKKATSNQQQAVNKAQATVDTRTKALSNAKGEAAKTKAKKALNEAKEALKKRTTALNTAKNKIKFDQKQAAFTKTKAALVALKKQLREALLADPATAALQQAVNVAQQKVNAAQQAVNAAQASLDSKKKEVPPKIQQTQENIKYYIKQKNTAKTQKEKNQWQAKIDTARDNLTKLQGQIPAAQAKLTNEKKVFNVANGALSTAQQALSQALPTGTAELAEDSIEEEEEALPEDYISPEDEADAAAGISQKLEGTFELAAKTTATIKLTATIIDDSEAANAIVNSAIATIEGSAPIESNKTTVGLCRTAACGEPEVQPVVPPTAGEAAGAAIAGVPASIPSTGPGAIAAGIVGVSALGYGARQWMASRRAMHDAMDSLYKK